MTDKLTWLAEYTDTFAGEANYSWVRKAEFQLPIDSTRRQIVAAGKAAIGMTGARCKTFEHGEGYELRPIGCCTVLFVLPQY